MASLAANVYCNALFEIASEKNEVEKLSKEAEQLISIWEENQELPELFNSPVIIKEEKQKFLKDLFADRFSTELVGLLMVMTEKERQNEILEVLRAFTKMSREYQRIGEASVTSAVELSLFQKRKVEKQLLKITGYESFHIQYDQDPLLLGGMVVKIGDKVIDGSVRTQLDNLTKSLNRANIRKGEEMS